MPQPEDANHDLVRQWLKKADEDFQTAEILLASDAPLYGSIGFHCQQAVEKWMKGWLTWRDVEFRKTHDLVELLDVMAKIDPALAQKIEESAILTHYAVVHRYPGDLPDLSRQEALSAVRITRYVRETILIDLPRK